MNQFWYPEFGLFENPFHFSDRAYELQKLDDDIPNLVDIGSANKIAEIASSHANIIIIGEKGCGKSSALELVEEILKNKGESIYSVIASQTSRDFYQDIFSARSSSYSINDLERKSIEYRMNDNRWYRYFRPNLESNGVLLCDVRMCYRGKKCVLSHGRNLNVNNLINVLPRDINCPLLQQIAIEVFSCNYFESLLLADVPDDISDKNVIYFVNFMQELGNHTSGTVLMATREQYSKLKKSEYFQRWLTIEFPMPTETEIKKIIENRINDYRSNDRKYPSLFTDDSLDYFIEKCQGNLRTIFQRCYLLLIRMKNDDLVHPADMNYVKSFLEEDSLLKPISEIDAINRIIIKLKESSKDWYKVKEIREMLIKEYKINIDSRRIGRMLKKLNFDHRRNPDSEYKIK